MSRTIAELENGTSVWIEENGTPVEYILVKKDEESCIVLRRLCSTMKRMHSSNVSVYEGCEADLWLENTTNGFLSRFDANTLSAFVNRNILTMTYGDSEAHTILRKCFIPSYKEALNGSDKDGYFYFGYAFGSLSGRGISVAYDDVGTTAVVWWLRSPYSATSFRNVVTNGSVGSGNAAYSGNWLRPALSVANATIVSDVGADTIYLLAQGTQYHECEATFGVGSSVNRPKKAIVRYDTTNLYDIEVKVCNNYNDVNPVWVNATSQQAVLLNNNSKESEHWQVGIKLYGKTPLVNGIGTGYFKEPFVLFETD